jgi:AcrR family transcriptional regulator
MRPKDLSKEDAIREKALDMIARCGLDGLSMQKLAKAAGVSPATIYIYFKDREDLIIQLCRAEWKRMSGMMMQGFDPEMDFEEGLRVQWKNRARFSIEHPQSLQFMEYIRHTPFHEDLQRAMDNPFKDAMKIFVTKAIRNKQMITMPVEVYWSLAYSPLYQLIKFHMNGRNMAGEPFELTDEIMEQTLQLVLKAFKP